MTSMVLNYKTSPEIKNIVLCIGTNNNFRTGNIKQLFKAVKRTFPNATIYVIKGGKAMAVFWWHNCALVAS